MLDKIDQTFEFCFITGSEGCWYKIAWAFLRPVGTVGLLHINKKVRLQLYRPKKNFKKFGRNKCEVKIAYHEK